MALLRSFLGADRGEVAVTAHASTALLSDPVGRDAWRGDTEPRPASLVRAHLDLGDGRTGLYDFTPEQPRPLVLTPSSTPRLPAVEGEVVRRG